jgi:hypothetical protein
MERSEIVKKVLTAYVDNNIAGRFSSQDICDNVRDICEVTPREVTEHMLNNGWHLMKRDERLVWDKT